MNIQAAVTMAQLQQKLDVISNNIANIETPGFKKGRGAFSSLLVREINNLSSEQNEVGRSTPQAIRTGTGARLGMIQMDTQRGMIKETGRGLDIALKNERHMIHLAIENGNAIESHFTRNGSLQLSDNGWGSLTLTTRSGHAVISKEGLPIVVDEPFSDIKIADDGHVILYDENNQEIGSVGQINLVEAVRPEILERVGQDYFKLPVDLLAMGFVDTDILAPMTYEEQQGAIQTGSLESSNVDLAEEMTELINTQRAYQFNARTISMGDQMSGLVNQLR